MKENRTGKKFKSLREDAKYSQEKLARLLNCKPEQVVQWENGEEEPSLDQCMLMCRLYGMTADEMFSHINSVPRKSLNGKTPYEMFSFIYGDEILKKLNIQKIAKDEVCTTPRLLK